jgi:hypothetical protein
LEEPVKLLPRRRRNRFAAAFAALGIAAFLSGAAGAALAPGKRGRWIFAVAGLAGYAICESRAMRLWAGRGVPTLSHRPLLGRSRARHAVAVAALALGATSLHAQQTVFSVPSADVLDKGKTYVEADGFLRFDDPTFSYLTARGVHGIGSRLEIGANIGGLNLDGPDAGFVTPNIKWQPVQSGDFRITTGAFGLFYFDSDDGDEAALGYAHAAWRIPSTQTRLTFGGWVASDGYAGPDSEAGVLAALEQPIGSSGWILAADYFSGENALGYLNPGIIYTTGPWAFYGTYSIKNGDSNGNGLLLEVGLTF